MPDMIWDKEPPAITVRDWRLQAITWTTEPKVMPSGTFYPAGSVVESVGFLRYAGRTWDLALPSPIAMYMCLATQAELDARAALARALKGLKGRAAGTSNPLRKREVVLFDGIQARAGAVVFSYMAIEAFANDAIPSPYVYTRTNRKTGAAESLTREQIERQVSLEEKLDAILPSVCRVASPRGTGLWQGLRWLTMLRDHLVHLKRSQWRGKHPHQSPSWIWSRLLKERAELSPWHARNLIWHYLANDIPRWLWRYSKQHKRHFEGAV